MEDNKELTTEEKLKKLEKNMEHAIKLFQRTKEKFDNLKNTLNYFLNDFNNGDEKNQLIKELTQITAKLIRNDYKNDQEKINDMLKQAYITGKLENMSYVVNGCLKGLLNNIINLEPYTYWKEP